MLESADIRCSISPGLVINRYFDDFEILLYCAENQVKISKRVELAEIRAVSGNKVIIFFAYHLGPAQSILESLA